MSKVVFFVEQDFREKRGLANAVLNRIKYMIRESIFDIDVFAIQRYSSFKKKPKYNELQVDGVKLNIIWKRFSIIDYFLVIKLRLKPIVNRNFYKNIVPLCKSYDIVSCHNIECGEIGYLAKLEYKIPYVSSWYGSDVHSTPFYSSYYMNMAKKVMDNADMNFFVSRDLMNKSNAVSETHRKDILYIGVREGYSQMSEEKKISLKNKYSYLNKKVIAFVGGLFNVKNPLVLPDIFSKVSELYEGSNLDFWIIGSGDLMDKVKNKCHHKNVPVRFWGYVSDEMLPQLLNCIDVLVIPSFNEGLPLITVEAISCGANVVGSKVGGIPEVIGDENTFFLDDSFVLNISSRIIQMIKGKIYQVLPPMISWEYSAHHECEVLRKILRNQ